MFQKDENLEKIFKAISYIVAFCGLLSLFSSGGIGIIIFSCFSFIILLSFFLEKSKWQLGERTGVVLIFLIVPLFYLDWYYHLSGFSTRDAFTGGSLSRIILLLGSIKLLQRKSDRDWIFIYVISFFEILLAAGISVSPFFFVSLILYLLFAFSSIILFEIRKTSKALSEGAGKKEEEAIRKTSQIQKSQLLRLPITALGLLLIIILAAVPVFFAFPRFGSAGYGSSLNNLSSYTGFSDSVRLGAIGKLQQNDEVVMRVRIENGSVAPRNMRWRGVALDNFENQTWRNSRATSAEPYAKNERDFFLLDTTTNPDQLITQTVYLEPIDTPTLFALSRPLAVQGSFQALKKNSEGAIDIVKTGAERISYKVFSDVSLPAENVLRVDDMPYSQSARRYLQLPKVLDERVASLSQSVITGSVAHNRYDQARAVERYLQTQFGYSLDMRAGGKDPLADFLFNVKEGHCEYFASAMAIMLRTQGIATRVVNGFQAGEYNETADVFVVKQKDAHSWVEVYFPQEDAWIPFDPTPAAGQPASQSNAGFTSQISKYLEALETFWIQYVVSYDNQEQRSLFRTIRRGLSSTQETLADWAREAQQSLIAWWHEVRGDDGLVGTVKAIGMAVLYLAIFAVTALLLLAFYRRMRKFKPWQRFFDWVKHKNQKSIVEFYERMQKVLAAKGLKRAPHQTPLEFAFALDMPEAVKITEKYNRVRFGEKSLSSDEAREIENWLTQLEQETV